MMHRKKLLTRLLLLAALLTALTVSVQADAVTDTIGVYIGYFGWSEDQYVEKATYHWMQLDDWYGGALDTHEDVYSHYNGSRTYLALGRGFYIRDLLECAGVDLNSIASIDFFTKDHSNGAYRSFTKKVLFDSPRYYFPYLAANEETGALYSADGGDDLWVGAQQVEAMLALEDYTQWDAVGIDFEALADASLYSTGSRFHLFFGQASPQEQGTSSAAKYVYKILVTFAGAPVLSTEETDLSLTVGSDHALHLSVSAEDVLLDDYVSAHIIWTSSDESVVKVDANGNLTPVGDGTATVTASYGSASTAVSVRVGGGSGSGQGDGLIGESGGQTNDNAAASQKPQGVYILSGAALQRETSPAGTAAGEKMGDGSTQLELTAANDAPVALTFAVLGAFALLGYGYGVWRYKKLR